MKTNWVLMLSVCGSLLLPAVSNAAIYLEYAVIPGYVSAAGYETFHDISSIQWGVGRAVSMPGGGAGREASNPSFSEITLTRQTDDTSAQFFLETVVGRGAPVKLHFVRTGADRLLKYMLIELDEVMITSLSMSADSEGAPQESITLNYTKIWITTYTVDGKGVPQPNPRRGYDLAKAVAL